MQTDLFKAFDQWYAQDTAGDEEFSEKTGEYWRLWAEGQGLLDDLLMLPERGMSMREWISIKCKPLASGNPFPDVRRKGGDHDRGFSPALNEEMRKRNRRS